MKAGPRWEVRRVRWIERRRTQRAEGPFIEWRIRSSTTVSVFAAHFLNHKRSDLRISHPTSRLPTKTESDIMIDFETSNGMRSAIPLLNPPLFDRHSGEKPKKSQGSSRSSRREIGSNNGAAAGPVGWKRSWTG